jgi:iron complex outermembrane receptor protein
LLIGTSVIAFAVPAAAQTTPEQTAGAINQANQQQPVPQEEQAIIVTATKRATTVQDVPFSVNAQTQADIQRTNARTLEDLSRNVAGLAVQNLGPGQSQVSIRGVSAGQIVRDQPGVKEQVGVYLDESVVSLSLFTPDFDLFDLNRVETLRGPQGTLFGSGSVGGTIRYITNQPLLNVVEGEVEGDVNVLKGGDIGYGGKAALNVPLGDELAARAVGYYTHFGGFIDAVGPAGGKNINDGRRAGGRLSLLYQPVEAVKITPRIVYQSVEANGFNREEFYNLYDNQFTTGAAGTDLGERKQYLKLPEEFRDKTLLTDLVASIDIGPAELTSVSTYMHRSILVSRDASALSGSVGVTPLLLRRDQATGVIIPGALAGTLDPAIVLLPSNLRDTTKLNQLTQELRLASTGTGPLQWVVGAFYTHVRRNYKQRLPTPGYDAFIDAAVGLPGFSQLPAVANGFGPDSPYNANLPYRIRQKALFGEANYDFGQFKLTAGGRWYGFRETRDFVSGGLFSNADTRIGDKTHSTGFNPRVIGTWEPNRNLSVNLQAAKGFRVGGINDPLNLGLCTPDDVAVYGPFQSDFYKDETLWNYEAGVKYQRHGITFNAAAFHTRIRDLQVTVDAGSCSSRIVLNVDKAHTTGVEAEIAAHPLVGLDLSLAGSYIDSKFDSTVANPILATRSGIREGNRLPSVPKFQMAATATYGTRLTGNSEWYATASFQHVGSRFTQPGDQESANEFFDFIFFDPATENFGFSTPLPPGTHFGSLRLPSYNLVNLSAGVKWDSGLELVAYVKNLFDEDPKLSLDRERGGRARLGYNVGQPRTIGLTVRQSFGGRAAAPPPPAPVVPAPPPAVEQPAPPPPPPPPPPTERGN